MRCSQNPKVVRVCARDVCRGVTRDWGMMILEVVVKHLLSAMLTLFYHQVEGEVSDSRTLWEAVVAG